MSRTGWTWRSLLALLLAVPSMLVGVVSAADDGQASDAAKQESQPPILRRPTETPPSPPPALPPEAADLPPFLLTPADPPLGFAGPSKVPQFELQESSHFVPVPDRWRIGFPDYDRYDKGHPPIDDYLYKHGTIWDPFNQNVLKGDYPIFGQNIFLNMTASTDISMDYRQVPTATTPFESTRNPFQEEFFGNPNQFLYRQNLRLSFDLFQGNAGFKQPDWRLHVQPVFNVNVLNVNELAQVNTNVLRGEERGRDYFALQEWFAEYRLFDTSPDFDFVSVRVGSQPFVSDFRGFIFSDTNRAVRLFGTMDANREQWNLVFFRQLEKDTNSELNTFHERHQGVLIANYYMQDFIFPGYTAQVSFHYNHDDPTFKIDKNNFLVRPAPAGIFQPHDIEAAYLGWAGDGHIGRFNITHQLYYAFGHDGLNPLAGQDIDIDAWFFAAELSYDRDWARFRVSFLWAEGDDDITDKHGHGFDSILDNQNFAGGDFSYWQRQAIGLFGVNLVNRESLLPDLRPNKIQGQSNFVNPGLVLLNFGVDFDLTPKLKMINNLNFLWFDQVNVLNQFVFQKFADRFIGEDLSTGFEYRPLLSDNIIIVTGIEGLVPGQAFKDLYDKYHGHPQTPMAGFAQVVLTY